MAHNEPATTPLDEIPREVWQRLFVSDPDGQKVLEALAATYLYRRLDVPGDPYATHTNAGAANLVNDLIQRLAE